MYKSNLNVISQQLIERQLQITVVAPSQPEGFSAVNPILEHVYFNVLSQNS